MLNISHTMPQVPIQTKILFVQIWIPQKIPIALLLTGCCLCPTQHRAFLIPQFKRESWTRDFVLEYFLEHLRLGHQKRRKGDKLVPMGGSQQMHHHSVHQCIVCIFCPPSRNFVYEFSTIST